MSKISKRRFRLKRTKRKPHIKSKLTRKHRGSGKRNNTSGSKSYSTQNLIRGNKSTSPNGTLLKLLEDCSLKNREIRDLVEKGNRKTCKFDTSCYRVNPIHKLAFKHKGENLGQVEIDAYRNCTDEYLKKSWKLFTNNGEQLPNEWYVAIGTYLQTWDFTDQHSLYFNILANICQHGKEYVNMYSKRFIEYLLVGMEESAVTGMFDITNRPELMKCLSDIKSPDDRYLSNTALLSLTKR